MVACKKLFGNFIIDWCGHKMIFKLKNWTIREQNGFETDRCRYKVILKLD